MSDQIVQSVDDTNGRNGRIKQTVESYQSVWMAHWMRARCSAAGEIHEHNASETEGLDSANMNDNLTNGLEISRNLKLFGFIVTKTFEIVDEGVKMSPKGIENEKMQTSLFEYDRLPNAKQSDYFVNASFPKNNTSGQGWFPKMKCSGTELFPTSEKTETKKSYDDCNSPQMLQNCAHDGEKAGIRTTVDSVGGAPGGSHSFPQITHILSKENDIFTSGRVFTEINRNTSGYSGQGKPLTSIDSEAKENHERIKAFKEKNLNSGTCSATSTKHSLREVGCRWGKRPKLSSPNSSDQGSKGSNLDENSSHEETNKSFDRMHKSSISSSNPELSDKSMDCLKNDKDCKNRGKRLLLSNAWIQRWLHKKPETLVVCELQSSKLEDPKTEQLPSIAAMALMGKAMTGFKPCDIQKRGSFTIWSTKAF